MSNFKVPINEIENYLLHLIRKSDDNYWREKFEKKNVAIHLAVMIQPYLSRILSGEKTIESRYSINMVSPYERIKMGDIVLLKKTGGSVVALFEAGKVRFFKIQNSGDLAKIKEIYNDRLIIDEAFWEKKKNSKYATLIDIQRLLMLPQFTIDKNNRTAWMTINQRQEELLQMKIFDYTPIVCISGKIASGKTYTSRSIVDILGGCRHSTSDYLKYRLKAKGNESPTRKQLQEQGEIEINHGWDSFANSFLDYIYVSNPKNITVVDGIRHLEFFNALKSAVHPRKCLLIYLEISDDIVADRINERAEGNITYNHVAEGNLQELKDVADYISCGNLEEIIVFIKNSVQRLG